MNRAFSRIFRTGSGWAPLLSPCWAGQPALLIWTTMDTRSYGSLMDTCIPESSESQTTPTRSHSSFPGTAEASSFRISVFPRLPTVHIEEPPPAATITMEGGTWRLSLAVERANGLQVEEETPIHGSVSIARADT